MPLATAEIVQSEKCRWSFIMGAPLRWVLFEVHYYSSVLPLCSRRFYLT